MLAPVLSAALSAIAPGSATADVNRIEAFPVEVEVNSGWGDTTVVLIMSISPISSLDLHPRKLRAKFWHGERELKNAHRENRGWSGLSGRGILVERLRCGCVCLGRSLA
jgi:hypothetical protein